jgi:hypothetical protein
MIIFVAKSPKQKFRCVSIATQRVEAPSDSADRLNLTLLYYHRMWI